MSIKAIPASDPKSPAWGMRRCTRLPANASASFIAPMIAVAAMPRYQISSPAAVGESPDARNFANAGPSTNSAMPMVEGVSRPNGIAVTSERPLRLAKRTANHV